MDTVVISKIESWDIPLGKLRILFINIFTILYKAATLNPRKLRTDMKIIYNVLKRSCSNTILSEFYILFVSLVIFAKFLFGYVRLAANIIAMFPILAEEGRELLLPSILAQAVENIFFCALDVIIGSITVRYFIPCKFPLFVIYVAKNIIQVSIGLSVLRGVR
ncbi:uncharacterized protein LOC128870009 [Anastrepha ludens]|uniref:uncharacterized protein LOC128870009 n=1 Tax=Anastrepha ludens TaxID=28586 RepID=UPI0023AF2E0D|nr:uncharacterized protein LOC128870009 [Anastrepha ludens]